tara:strand:- start:1616 stop:1822 length:207 start_codon:yes stop_codon:yes gene_type:complete
MLNNNPKDFNDVDGLNVIENPDGTFQVEWDENDPRYSMFKGLTEEQIQHMITEGLREIINREDDDEGW